MRMYEQIRPENQIHYLGMPPLHQLMAPWSWMLLGPLPNYTFYYRRKKNKYRSLRILNHPRYGFIVYNKPNFSTCRDAYEMCQRHNEKISRFAKSMWRYPWAECQQVYDWFRAPAKSAYLRAYAAPFGVFNFYKHPHHGPIIYRAL